MDTSKTDLSSTAAGIADLLAGVKNMDKYCGFNNAGRYINVLSTTQGIH